MYALHALKFARRFRRYNKPFKPLFDRFADSVGLGRLGDGAVFDLPRYLGYSGIAAGSAGIAMAGMKRQRQSYAARARASARSQAVGKRRKIAPMPRQAMPYRMASKANRVNRPRKAGGVRKFLKRKSRLSRKKIPIKPNLLVPYVIERHQGVRNERPDDDPDVGPVPLGYYNINYGQDPGQAGATPFPLYLADLTALNQAGTTPIMHQCVINDDGFVGFNQVFVQTNGLGNVTTRFLTEDARHDATGTSVKLAQIPWYDIRLKLYGCRKQSVTYTVSLIKFKRDYMDWTMTPPAGNELDQRTVWYQGMVRRLTQNTILPVNNDWKRFVTILKQKVVNIDSGSSDELDRNPPSVDVKWFIRDGKIRNYSEATVRFPSDVQAFNVGWNVRSQVVVSPVCPARDRVYLMIQATDMTNAAVDPDQDQDSTPSFDCIIRRRVNKYAVD